ncbi:uncharacterized protein LOC26534951 isoform X3 [Drosophila yakuba]|uniref:uncharacterized protein LOC120322158 isoform X2 n=1 Tax=Drosophila yakuba TaxID=7245 RepID=UPI00193085F6|nr:uncharacterized protein LOC120322158 isoform X2 [Drosophila yakuba]XP_039233128.1 uncharacterized protein LOC26534951 isoform X3 [Drosophila yakuba]
MVDEQLSGALRDLPGRVLNVPVEERQHLFRNVSSVLRHSGAQRFGMESTWHRFRNTLLQDATQRYKFNNSSWHM